MSEFEFDWATAGVTAKTDWTDSQTFSNIAGGVDELSSAPASSIVFLPVDTVGGVGKTENSGRTALKREADYVVEVVNLILAELSDACAVLGSGVETAASNFDATESNTTQSFDFLTSKVPE